MKKIFILMILSVSFSCCKTKTDLGTRNIKDLKLSLTSKTELETYKFISIPEDQIKYVWTEPSSSAQGTVFYYFHDLTNDGYFEGEGIAKLVKHDFVSGQSMMLLQLFPIVRMAGGVKVANYEQVLDRIAIGESSEYIKAQVELVEIKDQNESLFVALSWN